MKKIIGILFIAGLLGLLGWQIYQRISETRAVNPGTGPPGRTGPPGNNPGGGFGKPAVAVEIADVRHQTIQDVGQFTGSLLPKSQFIVVPKVSGRLVRLFVDVGDRVKRGQLIAQLDDEEFRQQIERAKADLEVAKANLAESQSALAIAKRDFDRAKSLSEGQILSQSKLDAAEATYNAAVAKEKISRATVMSRETSVETAQLNLSYTEIKATWESGEGTRVVGERFVDEGSILRANDPIVSILELSSITSVIHVIERDYFKVRQGQEAIITTDAFSGKTFTGRIARIAPMLKEQSRQARVEIEIPNSDELLKPGMFVRVEIQFDNIENATVVPMAALTTRNEQKGVFVADVQNLTAQFVPVTVGVTNNDLVQIVEPSISGSVVTLGQHLLEDGASIVLPEEFSGEQKSRKGPPEEKSKTQQN
jgi:RND family efflux transporter MFP subunit